MYSNSSPSKVSDVRPDEEVERTRRPAVNGSWTPQNIGLDSPKWSQNGLSSWTPQYGLNMGVGLTPQKNGLDPPKTPQTGLKTQHGVDPTKITKWSQTSQNGLPPNNRLDPQDIVSKLVGPHPKRPHRIVSTWGLEPQNHSSSWLPNTNPKYPSGSPQYYVAFHEGTETVGGHE